MWAIEYSQLYNFGVYEPLLLLGVYLHYRICRTYFYSCIKIEKNKIVKEENIAGLDTGAKEAQLRDTSFLKLMLLVI